MPFSTNSLTRPFVLYHPSSKNCVQVFSNLVQRFVLCPFYDSDDPRFASQKTPITCVYLI